MNENEFERSEVTERPDMPGSAKPEPAPARRGRLRVSRRTLITLAAALVAVLALVVVPAIVSSQASFFSRYPGIADEYSTWSTSAHAEVSCEQCHVPPRALAKVGYRLLMVGQVYLAPFSSSAPDVFRTPANDACLACHSDLRTVSPEGDLQIPHRAHVTILKMKCVQCHNYLVHEASPSGDHVPQMEDCLTCHNGDRAKDACSACHTEKAAPPTHAAKDWLVVHPQAAKASPECVKCHDWAGNWCVQCHESRPASHGNDWRKVHGAAVKAHRNCEACHDGPFCVKCHGVVPQLDFDPALEMVK